VTRETALTLLAIIGFVGVVLFGRGARRDRYALVVGAVVGASDGMDDREPSARVI